MTVTTSCTLDVPIHELHQAIRAVLPHADKPKLGDPQLALARIRIIAAANEVQLLATNGRTAAMACVGIIDGSDSRTERFDADDGVFGVDIHPAMLRDLRDGVTAQKDDGELIGEARITIEGPSSDGQPGTITVQDVGGLWLGSITTRPLLPHAESFPDIAEALANALKLAEGAFKPLITDAVDLTPFEAAAKAYGEPLMLEPIGRPEQRGWLVLCGRDFADTLPGNHTDDSLRRRDSQKRAHLERHGLLVEAASF
jgi:hypothetical protein